MLLIVRRRLGWLLRRTPADLPYYLLVFQTVVALAISPLPHRSLGAVWPHALGLALYFVITRWPWSLDALRWGHLALAILTGALAIVGIAGMGGLRLPGWIPAVVASLRGRLGDTFNPNVVAGYLALLVPITFGLLIAPRPRTRGAAVGALWGILPLMTLLAGLAVLVLSSSRAGLTAGVLGVCAVLAIRWPKVVLPILGAGAVAAAVIVRGVSLESIGEILSAGGGSVAGLAGRVEIWQRALYILQDFSFTGLGYGCFEPVVEVMYPLFLSASGTQPHAHNLLLQVGVDLGLPGLVAYLSLTGITFWLLMRSMAARGSGQRTALAGMSAALFAGLLGVQVHGILDAAVWGNKGAFIPWAVAAMAVPLYEEHRRVTEQVDDE
ncbi:MAG: O-antigen ligase family protein [Chloroflexi bacterium]|nr:O-antigen ligase family protein [Chloroflexota bacterium]